MQVGFLSVSLDSQKQLKASFGRLIVPDKSQPIFYALEDDQIRAHRLLTTFPEIGSRRVQYPPALVDKSDIFQRDRAQGYLFDHPIAFTHGDRLHLFVLTVRQGLLLRAEVPTFETLQENGYASRAAEALAALGTESQRKVIPDKNLSHANTSSPADKPNAASNLAPSTAEKAVADSVLQLGASFPNHIPAGEEFRYEWQLPSSTKIELLSTLTGLTLSPTGQLRWQPNEDQNGKHELKFRLTNGDQLEIQRLEIEVVDASLLKSLGGDLSKFATTQRLPLDMDEYFLANSHSGPRMFLLQGEELSILAGNGHGLRLSPDGRRVTYLSFTGDPNFRGDLIGWNTKDFKLEPARYKTQGRGSTTELAFHPWLPMLATPSSDSAVFFDQDTGEILEHKLLMPSQGLSVDKVERVHFTPDGKHLLFVCTSSEGRFLRSVNLRLSAKELSNQHREPITFGDSPPRAKLGHKVNVGELTALKSPTNVNAVTPKEIGRRYLDAVVTIKSNRSTGSGFFISNTGYALTSAHVIENATKHLNHSQFRTGRYAIYPGGVER